MRIEEGLPKLDYNDVLIKPKRSTIVSRSQVDLTRRLEFKHAVTSWTGVPLISSNMSTVTTVSMVKRLWAHNMLSCLPKAISKADLKKLIIRDPKQILIPSVGLSSSTQDVKDYVDMGCEAICFDVANGYMEKLVYLVESMRSAYRKIIIIAGNVVTPDMTEALILAGADVVKVGLGSGSACATRCKTGIGYPQLSAVIECADAAHGLGGHIIADGGCTSPGDVAKAFGAGADIVMLGGMLAGHKESGGKIVTTNGKKHVEFYGMSSKTANDRFAGGLKTYRASEGWELKIPYKGSVEDTLQDIEGGLRSTCAYIGAKKIKDLPKCTTFIRVNRQLNTSLLRYSD